MGTSERDWSGPNDFFFIKATTKNKKKVKSRPGEGYTPPSVEYDPDDIDKEWSNQGITSQIRKTLSFLDKKSMRSGDEIFYVAALKYRPSEHDVRNLFERLDAKVIAYLNKQHSKILVSASGKELRKLYGEVPKYVENSLSMMRPWLPSDQISEGAQGDDDKSKKLLLFRIMPNLEPDKHRNYLKQTESFLRQKECRIYETDLDETGMVVADADAATARSLADDATFVFSITAAPAGMAVKMKKRKARTLKKMRRNTKGLHNLWLVQSSPVCQRS